MRLLCKGCQFQETETENVCDCLETDFTMWPYLYTSLSTYQMTLSFDNTNSVYIRMKGHVMKKSVETILLPGLFENLRLMLACVCFVSKALLVFWLTARTGVEYSFTNENSFPMCIYFWQLDPHDLTQCSRQDVQIQRLTYHAHLSVNPVRPQPRQGIHPIFFTL